MLIASKTDTGLVRSNNQDSYAAGEFSKNSAWAVVCDGMGGTSGGNIASAMAVKVISETILNSIHSGNYSGSIKNVLESAIYNANIAVFDKARENSDLSGMGTTVVALIINNGMAYIAHAGDSRAYLINGDNITQITRDHSIVQSMIENGQITSEEARFHPSKNVITRALGIGDVVDTEFTEVKLNSNDKLLLCTDGLTNYLQSGEIINIISSSIFSDIPSTLISAANKAGGGDNITAVILSIEG
ncbi:MAG: Stp1/IreP family PP2C-type Ser/Thr phosphatase [Oscillospiraceae bacterium]|nr:Stp1/IreP family PP2C-type Ser/Thr phosphatase [Oscillospiraceae bacterium]